MPFSLCLCTEGIFCPAGKGNHVDGCGHRAGSITRAFKTGNALVIPHRSLCRHIDIHGTGFGAGIAGYAGWGIAPYAENPEKVKNTKQGAIGAGIFAEGTLDK